MSAIKLDLQGGWSAFLGTTKSNFKVPIFIVEKWEKVSPQNVSERERDKRG